MTCIDDATRMVHIYGMAVKNHASEKFKKYIVWLKSETGCDVWRVQSDCGGEYCISSGSAPQYLGTGLKIFAALEMGLKILACFTNISVFNTMLLLNVCNAC